MSTFLIPELQRVVCAAIMDQNGLIICSPRHYDHRCHKTIAAMPAFVNDGNVIQGFVDQWGNFLDREEAKIVAERVGQPLIETSYKGRKLFSENLY